ncbi:MAG: PadR family transcriptional regulator [Planctomycetes bacterium]|nr:PadR family transcriptional regulator [Planctomycetota bacterium]
MNMKAKFFGNRANQLHKGVLELCILNDIRNRKMYGYEIVRKLGRVEGMIINKGVIYPILRRLKRSGLVETFMQDSHEGPTRKYYKLTEKGRDMVGQMNAYWDAIKNQTGSIEKGQKRRRT